MTDDPAKHTTDACSPGTNAAVWNMNLSVAGQTLVVPIYVNPTSGAATALGAYKLTICLPPWDVPVGTPGRSFEGAQLLDAKFTVNKIFTTPTGAGLERWDALFTPYTPGKGTPNPAGTFEARAFVPLPISLGIKASYVKKSNTWKLKGSASEGGLPLGGLAIKIARGLKSKSLVVKSSATTTGGRYVDSLRSPRAEEDDVLPGERLRRRARLHRDGLPEPVDGARARRLRVRDAFALVGEEHRGRRQALRTVHSGSGRALPCTA